MLKLMIWKQSSKNSRKQYPTWLKHSRSWQSISCKQVGPIFLRMSQDKPRSAFGVAPMVTWQWPVTNPQNLPGPSSRPMEVHLVEVDEVVGSEVMEHLSKDHISTFVRETSSHLRWEPNTGGWEGMRFIEERSYKDSRALSDSNNLYWRKGSDLSFGHWIKGDHSHGRLLQEEPSRQMQYNG